jgi:hypothetical protein
LQEDHVLVRVEVVIFGGEFPKSFAGHFVLLQTGDVGVLHEIPEGQWELEGGHQRLELIVVYEQAVLRSGEEDSELVVEATEGGKGEARLLQVLENKARDLGGEPGGEQVLLNSPVDIVLPDLPVDLDFVVLETAHHMVHLHEFVDGESVLLSVVGAVCQDHSGLVEQFHLRLRKRLHFRRGDLSGARNFVLN